MTHIEKVTLNIGVGGPGEKMEKAKKLLAKLTGGEKPIETKSYKRIPAWNIRPGLAIGAKITLRSKKAEEMLKRCLEVVDRKIKEKSIDPYGNFSFGVPEYIDVPGIKYDPEIGLFGFDVCVTMAEKGYRTGKRKLSPRKVPKSARTTRENTTKFLNEKFGVEVE